VTKVVKGGKQLSFRAVVSSSAEAPPPPEQLLPLLALAAGRQAGLFNAKTRSQHPDPH
jgi:hypothetical protein